MIETQNSPDTSLPLGLSTAVTTFSPPKNKRQKKYRSVISDVFDGTIVSSVQCLTCDRVSCPESHSTAPPHTHTHTAPGRIQPTGSATVLLCLSRTSVTSVFGRCP